jgi:hypothetical protein
VRRGERGEEREKEVRGDKRRKKREEYRPRRGW